MADPENLVGTLSPAELRVLTMLALPQDIAAYRLGLSARTVKFHARRIAEKFGDTDTKGVIAIAASAGVKFEIMRLNRCN